MYIVKSGILYLKAIGETNEAEETQISMCIDPAQAMQFETERMAQAANDRFDVRGKVVQAPMTQP